MPLTGGASTRFRLRDAAVNTFSRSATAVLSSAVPSRTNAPVVGLNNAFRFCTRALQEGPVNSDLPVDAFSSSAMLLQWVGTPARRSRTTGGGVYGDQHAHSHTQAYIHTGTHVNKRTHTRTHTHTQHTHRHTHRQRNGNNVLMSRREIVSDAFHRYFCLPAGAFNADVTAFVVAVGASPLVLSITASVAAAPALSGFSCAKHRTHGLRSHSRDGV